MASSRLRLRIVPTLPLLFLAVVLVAAIMAPVLTPFDPLRQDLTSRLLPPAFVDGGVSKHLLGTDGFGRDVLTRMIYGARVSFSVAITSLLIAVTLGLLVGLVAGYFGGVIDSVLMRIVDAVLAVPTLLVALVIAIAIGPSFRNVVLVLGLLNWPRIARLIRGETLLLKKQDYVRYSYAIGVPGWVILLRHLFPNVVPTLLVATTLEVGSVILTEASLSFLGAGVPPPQPSWGAMISEGEGLIATGWWISLFPGIAIALSVLSFNSIGDWLRDFLDPKMAQA